MVGGLSNNGVRGCLCHHPHGRALRAEADAKHGAGVEPTPPKPNPNPTEDVAFSYNPQDRSVMETKSKVIPGVQNGLKGNPETAHVMLNETLERENGSYVYPREDPRQSTAMTFANVAHTVNVFKEAFGEVKWAFKYDKLAINANGGKGFDAFYGRKNGTVNFFQEEDRILGRMVHSGSSGEIVAHEVGHAVLDGIRPEYFGAWRSDVGAFHESFGDILAMHVSLMDDRVVKRVAVQTGGDLSKANVVAFMAEELGTGLNNNKGTNYTGGDFLRNANNQFTWADPKTLPEKGGPDALGWEIHDFSRLWTAAHFDVFKGMVSAQVAAGVKPDVAIKECNSELLRMLANLMKEAPHGDFTYKDMAIAFVKSDKLHNGGKHADLIQAVFTARKILPADLPPDTFEPAAGASLFQSSSQPSVTNVELQLGEDFGMWSGARVDVPVSAERALFKSAEIQEETEGEMRRLIKAGKIRYNNPNYQMKFPEDYFNPRGEAYIGALTWEDGQMRIERLAIAT
jgi:hypothetical protein